MSTTQIVFPSVTVIIGTMGLILSILNSVKNDRIRDKAKTLEELIESAKKLLNVQKTPDAALLCEGFVKKAKRDLAILTIEATTLRGIADNKRFWSLTRTLEQQLDLANDTAAETKITIVRTTNDAVQASSTTTTALTPQPPQPSNSAGPVTGLSHPSAQVVHAAAPHPRQGTDPNPNTDGSFYANAPISAPVRQTTHPTTHPQQQSGQTMSHQMANPQSQLISKTG